MSVRMFNARIIQPVTKHVVPYAELKGMLPKKALESASSRLDLKVHDGTVTIAPPSMVRLLTGEEAHLDAFALLLAAYPVLRPGEIGPWKEGDRTVHPKIRGEWEGFDLSSMRIHDVDFFKASMLNVNFDKSLFVNCKLNNAAFTECSFRGVRMISSSLKGSGMYKSILDGASLKGVDARGTDFTECSVEKVDLQQARLLDTIWWGAKGSPIAMGTMNEKAAVSWGHRGIKELDMVDICHGSPDSLAADAEERLTRARLVERNVNGLHLTAEGKAAVAAYTA